jgi:hypothetical protein
MTEIHFSKQLPRRFVRRYEEMLVHHAKEWITYRPDASPIIAIMLPQAVPILANPDAAVEFNHDVVHFRFTEETVGYDGNKICLIKPADVNSLQLIQKWSEIAFQEEIEQELLDLEEKRCRDFTSYTDKEIVDLMQGDTLLNQVREAVTLSRGRIATALAQRNLPSTINVRRMEFETARKIGLILGIII